MPRSRLRRTTRWVLRARTQLISHAAAVGRLREDDQLIYAARYFLGLSEAETAIALGLRRGTVKSRLSRALERLQTQMEAMP